MNADPTLDALWAEVRQLLTELGDRIGRDVPCLTCRVARHANASFPLRAYLSILRRPSERELAVMVEVKRTADGWDLSSDVCYDDGTVVSVGPAADVVLTTVETRQPELAQWITRLRRFLDQTYETVVDAARAL